MNPEQILETMRRKEWAKAKWMTEALLLKNGVSRGERSFGSTKTPVPLSAIDLPTLLDMLLGIQTPTGSLVEGTSRSSLRKAVEYLRKNSGTNSDAGPEQEPSAASPTQSIRPLHSNRKYWPGEAKDVFWSLVRQLNKYDKESTEAGQRSPLQLSIAEEATRRWWRLEYDVEIKISERDRKMLEMASSALGSTGFEIVPGEALC